MAPQSDTCIRVLIVDDDLDALALTRELVLLASPGAAVATAHGAQQAMTYLRSASDPARGDQMPNVILLDINMPGAGGFEFLRWLRQNTNLAHLNVIMHSTSVAPAEIERATALGAHGYLGKFPDPTVLAEALRQAHPSEVANGHGPANNAGSRDADTTARCVQRSV